jgi:hypothetical protein
MPVRHKKYYKVTLGNHRRYFCDEEDARDFAKQRAADPDNWDGIPFVNEIDEREVITQLNELELGRATFMESYGNLSAA